MFTNPTPFAAPERRHARVLWIDRAPLPALAALREALRQGRVLVDVTEDRLTTLARAALYEYDLIVVDGEADSSPSDPLNWLPDVMARCPSVPVAMCTTPASYTGSIAAAKLGVFAHVETPDTVETVRALLQKAHEWQEARRTNAGRVR